MHGHQKHRRSSPTVRVFSFPFKSLFVAILFLKFFDPTLSRSLWVLLGRQRRLEEIVIPRACVIKFELSTNKARDFYRISFPFGFFLLHLLLLLFLLLLLLFFLLFLLFLLFPFFPNADSPFPRSFRNFLLSLPSRIHRLRPLLFAVQVIAGIIVPPRANLRAFGSDYPTRRWRLIA